MPGLSATGAPRNGWLPDAEDLSGEFRKYIGKQVSYATHGIHRYPAKFIPQIPKFCIDSYSKPGDTILDPFMGSGTTLLESYIAGRNCYGIDIHPLARLIAKVKIAPQDPNLLSDVANELLKNIRGDSADNRSWIPEIPNRDHWFRPEVLSDLATIKKNIWSLKDGEQKDFFKICFSSIIRKVSNSDSDSLIPEVTSFHKKLDEQGKTSYDAFAKFENVVKNRLIDASDLWKVSIETKERFRKAPRIRVIGEDGRAIPLEDSSIDLAVTSPPYASAVHYVSVHKLEMFWLDLIKSTSDLDTRIVGTSRAYVEDYRSWEPDVRIPELKSVLAELVSNDKKSAFIVFRYFEDMRKNICDVGRVLKKGSRYCVVVGENSFRRVRIPTYLILARIASCSGFDVERVFVYDVINRHLDIPRWNDSRIEKDHILVLRKRREPKGSHL